MRAAFLYLRPVGKWLLSLAYLCVLVGSVSAMFLLLLREVTALREGHLWIMAFLPLAGVFIVWCYARYGGDAQRGNNLLLETYYRPANRIPLRMAPMIILTTLLTHLFGGSAGREGTAIQYGGALTGPCMRWFSWSPAEKRILLLCGIAAGFASLFGTPWAGMLFALEVVQMGKQRWKGIPLILLSAFGANAVCTLYGNLHTHYPALQVAQPFDALTFVYLALAGLFFGLGAQLFCRMGEWFSHLFRYIPQPLLRPVVGAVLIILAVLVLGSSRHIGLGIPTILSSFENPLPAGDFFIKTVLTNITLSAGFKGGEVTPLFFIGATLGNALSAIIPLPLALLAATGFVSVFAGCTKTPLACTGMAMELFGWQGALFFLTTCLVSFLVSGKYGIYTAQRGLRGQRFYKRVFSN